MVQLSTPWVTPNGEWAPVRRFLSNYFDLLLLLLLLLFWAVGLLRNIIVQAVHAFVPSTSEATAAWRYRNMCNLIKRLSTICK